MTSRGLQILNRFTGWWRLLFLHVPARSTLFLRTEKDSPYNYPHACRTFNECFWSKKSWTFSNPYVIYTRNSWNSRILFYCTSFPWNNKTWSFNNRSRSCSSFASRHSSKKDQTYRRRLRNKKTDSKDDSCRSKCRWCFCNRDFFNLHQHGTRKGNWCHKDCFHSLFS